MIGKWKRQTACVVAMAMLLGMLNLWPASPVPKASAADADWPASVLGGTNMPFRPVDSLVTTQNPPDFSWPFVTGSDQYDLQVSREASFASVAHENDAILFNYFNFPVTFDSGTWYWRVRYHKPDGTWSGWSTVRKFRIDENNVPFIVPPVETMMSSVGNVHPRIWTNPSELASFRNLRLTGNSKTVVDQTLAAYAKPAYSTPPAEPTFPYMHNEVPTNSDAYVNAQAALKKYAEDALNDMQNAAFLYLVTGDVSYGNRARTLLLNLAAWDPNGSTSYRIHDQVHRAIAYRSAIAYDWIYDLLSDGDKMTLRAMIKARTDTLVQNYLSNQGFYKFPYDSHGWTIVGYIGIIATAMLNDMPEAADWYRLSVPLFLNVLPPWGGEDGSWSQGTGYWQWSSGSNKELMDVLLSSGAINPYDKAFSRHEGLYPLYMFPHGSPAGVFGDDSQYTPGSPSVSMLTRLAQIYDDSRLKWEADAIGAKSTGLTDYFYRADDVASQPPVDLPKGVWFPDTGAVAMHSELYETDRTSLYFRSSPYGTYNHTMSDQNAFVLNAFGESLALKAGYYDFYGSKHHANFTRQTYSANAITFDGRKGQSNDDISADGKILGFVTSPDFDAASGDATAAYKGGLSKAVRHIIYVRPSVYVVIDDLATTKDGGSEFEWNLHADDNLAIDPSNTGATISKGDANLKVQFYGQQAQSYRTTYETKYLGPDGKEYPPTGAFSGKSQIHAAFITPKTNDTKMIATLATYKRGETPVNVTPTEYANYMKLAFEDGTTLYVRKTNSGLVDTGEDGVQFDGAAAAVKGDSVLLVVGTKLVRGGVTLAESDSPATISYGGNQLSVSGQNDVQVSLAAPGLTEVREADSGDAIPSGGTVGEGLDNRGVQWTYASNTLTIHVEKGQRAFKLNGAAMPGPLAPVTLPTEIDGVTGSVTLQAYRDVNGESVAWGQLSNAQGFYEVLDAPAGFSFQKYGKIASGLLDANTSILLKGAPGGVLKLRSIGQDALLQTEQYQDPDTTRATLGIEWQEAESFTQWSGTKQPTIYDTRKFLSNGKGVSNWDQFGVSLKWKLNVPEDGTYDLVLKYVAGWDVTGEDTDSVRYVKLGDEIKNFKLPKTESFGSTPEQWRGLRVKTGVHLPAGIVDLTMYHSLGGVNLDWIGLIKVGDDEVRPSAPANLHEVSQADGQITIGWDPSTDNVAVKEYEVEVDGVKKLIVPFGTNTATVTGLSSGQVYAFRVTAVDTSGNRSFSAPGSEPFAVRMTDTTPPVWGDDAAVHTQFLSTQMVRLSWEPAVDNAGKVGEYQVYRQSGSSLLPVGTTKSTTFDAMGLQAGGTYTFKVEAKDDQGNATTDGPDVTVTLPSAVGTFVYDTFDNWTTGEAADFSGWSFTKTGGTSVQAAALPEGGNGLVALDNYYPSTDEYASSPVMRKIIANTGGGKLTVETRTMFSKVSHDVGNYLIDLSGNGKIFGAFVGFSDGGIGFQKLVNGVSTNVRLAEGYKQPKDQWMTIRFDIDFAAKTYDLTVQEDGLKDYGGPLVAGGQLDRATGVYRIVGIPFLDTSATLKGFEMFRFSAQRYTGKYTFDYLAVYPTQAVTTSLPAPALRLKAQTADSVTLSWDASADADASGYAIYQNGALKTTVSADTNTATLTGLTLGSDYTFAIRAVDAAGKPSAESRSLKVTLAGAPTWGEGAALNADLVFSNAVRLSWDPASDASGGVASYTVYRIDGASASPVGTVTGTKYDAVDLQPGGTYTFRVEAKNAGGGESSGGPEMTVTLPETSKAVYDSFDTWPDGEAADGGGWAFTKNYGTSVKAVALPDLGGKGLAAADTYYSASEEYATSPVLARTIGAIGGKVTVETRTMFSKVNHDVGNYTIDLAGNGKVFGEFVGFSDGGLGYQKTVNGTNTFIRMTDYNIYKQPADQWMSLRFDIDFAAKTYDLTVQADALKNYAGMVAAGGTLDRTTGVYKVEDIPFLGGASAVRGMELFRFYAQRFTGKYTFDSLIVYNTAGQSDVSAPTTTDDAPAGVAGGDVTVNLAASDDSSGVAVTRYVVDGGAEQTGNAVTLTEEGEHTIVYWSEDQAGNVEERRTARVKIDKTAPVSEAALDPAAPAAGGDPAWYNSPVRVSLSATDALSGVAKTEYRVNGGEWTTYGDPLGPFEEGIYKIEYRSTDHAGNVEPVKTVTVQVDETAPELTVELDPAILWPPNHQMVDIHAKLTPKDEGSGIASIVLTSVDSSEPDSGSGDIDAAVGTPADTFRLRAERVGGGTGRVYTIVYTVTDKAGNETKVTKTVTVPHNK